MKVVCADQHSPEWLQARTGRITASRIVDVLNFLKKGGEGASRRNYRGEIVAERLTGRSEEHYVSSEMMWGTEMEPFARAMYEMVTGTMVDTTGLVLHPTFDFAGGSPDGLVDDDGVIEIKCPKTTTHLRWLEEGGVPEDHQEQCIWNMVCTGRHWCDFVSFDPRVTDNDLKLFIVRMERDDARIAAIEEQVVKFNAEVEETITRLRRRKIPCSTSTESSNSNAELPLSNTPKASEGARSVRGLL